MTYIISEMAWRAHFQSILHFWLNSRRDNEYIALLVLRKMKYDRGVNDTAIRKNFIPEAVFRYCTVEKKNWT